MTAEKYESTTILEIETVSINQNEKQRQGKERSVWLAKKDPWFGFEAFEKHSCQLISVLFKNLKENFEFSYLC